MNAGGSSRGVRGKGRPVAWGWRGGQGVGSEAGSSQLRRGPGISAPADGQPISASLGGQGDPVVRRQEDGVEGRRRKRAESSACWGKEAARRREEGVCGASAPPLREEGREGRWGGGGTMNRAENSPRRGVSERGQGSRGAPGPQACRLGASPESPWGAGRRLPVASLLEGLGASTLPGLAAAGRIQLCSRHFWPCWQPGEDGSQLPEASHSPRPMAALLRPHSQQGPVESSHAGSPAPSCAESDTSRERLSTLRACVIRLCRPDSAR